MLEKKKTDAKTVKEILSSKRGEREQVQLHLHTVSTWKKLFTKKIYRYKYF